MIDHKKFTQQWQQKFVSVIPCIRCYIPLFNHIFGMKLDKRKQSNMYNTLFFYTFWVLVRRLQSTLSKKFHVCTQALIYITFALSSHVSNMLLKYCLHLLHTLHSVLKTTSIKIFNTKYILKVNVFILSINRLYVLIDEQ